MKRINVDCVVGIDPGASGGIVTWRPGHTITAIKMPKNIYDVKEYMEYLSSICRPIVFIEKLSVRPDDIISDNSGASMGKLFRIQKMIANYEQLKTTIELSGVPFALVHPMTWQSKLNLRAKGMREDKAERKRRYKEAAENLYPGMKQTLWSADATLIMHFGRYVLQSDVKWLVSNVPDNLQKKLFDKIL